LDEIKNKPVFYSLKDIEKSKKEIKNVINIMKAFMKLVDESQTETIDRYF